MGRFKDIDDSAFEIDDAPMVGSLDDLLAIDDKDLENASKKPYLHVYASDSEPINYPHVKISTKKFMEALRLSSAVSQGTGRDLIPKTLGLEVQGGALNIYLSDSEVFVEKSIDLINTDNILQGYFSLNYAVISSLIKSCSTITSIYKKDDKYYLKLIGGDMDIEDMGMDKSQLTVPYKKKFTDEGSINRNEFHKIIRNLFILASSSVTPAQRRVFFKDNNACAVYLFSMARFNSDNNYPEMDLKIKDMKILYNLVGDCEDIQINVKKNSNRAIISGSNFLYSFLVSEYTPPQGMLDNLDKVFEHGCVYSDYAQLSKFADTSVSVPHSLSRLDFNYTDSGGIEYIFKTKRGDRKFNLHGTKNSNVRPLDKHISIQSTILRSLLKVFSSETSIDLAVHELGIGIKAGPYDAVLYTETDD